MTEADDERRRRIGLLVIFASEDIAQILQQLNKDLIAEGSGLVSVAVYVPNFGVLIEVRPE